MAGTDRSGRLVLVAWFLLFAAIFGVGVLAWSPEVARTPIAVAAVSSAAAGIVFGAAFTLFLARSWRSHGGRAAVAERSRAVRSGRLPATADARWLPGLRARRQNARQLPWLLPSLAAVCLAIGATHVGDATVLRPAYWFVLAAVLLVLAVRAIRRRHDVAVLDRFIAEIAGRDGA